MASSRVFSSGTRGTTSRSSTGYGVVNLRTAYRFDAGVELFARIALSPASRGYRVLQDLFDDSPVVARRPDAVGLLLQRHRASLPADLERYRDERRAVQRQSRSTQEEMFDLDEQRRALANAEAHAVDLLVGSEPSTDAPREEVVTSVRSMLETQHTYLGFLFDDQARYFDALLELGAAYGELTRTAEIFLRFIDDERVVWTRNAEPLWWSDAAPAAEALAWLFGPAQWASLADDAARNPLALRGAVRSRARRGVSSGGAP